MTGSWMSHTKEQKSLLLYTREGAEVGVVQREVFIAVLCALLTEDIAP